MRNKVVITGASGFIGARVCQRFVRAGFEVVAVVSPFSSSDRLNSLEQKLKIVKADLSDPGAVEKIVRKHRPETVEHLATHGVYQYQQNDETRIILDNYLMTANLLNASVKFKVKKFVNTGSVFEYGSQRKKVRENDISLGDIINKYSAVKMATTSLTNSYAKELVVCTLRPFTTYGPGEDPSRFIRATIERALRNEDIKLVAGVTRDFVYVDDVAEAFYKAGTLKIKSGDIFNVAGGKKWTLERAAEVIKRVTKSKSKITFEKNYKRPKESACWADISRSKKVLKWVPAHSFKQGTIETVDFIKK